MQIVLIAVGKRMPAWVDSAYQEYANRLKTACQLRLVEIDAVKRTKHTDLQRAMAIEGDKILAAVPKGALIISLAIEGKAWNTPQLAQQMQSWMQRGSPVALLVGGPEGLASKCLQQSQHYWSLSPLTLPHPMVRVILAEQLFRAYSILKNHPYHR